MIFLIMGVASTFWFLVRVIPKPSRATYPCMQATAPVMSGFVVYLLGLLSTTVIFRGLKRSIIRARFVTAAVLLVAGLTSVGFLVARSGLTARADVQVPLAIHTPNEVMGEGQGIHPGRVVWAWNPEATNKNCNPTVNGDGWWLQKNNNQEVVDQMVEDAILKLTGESSVAEAWDALFKYHNKKKRGDEVSYAPGEKILIKTNVTSAWGAGESWGNMDDNFNKIFNSFYGVAETSPHVVLAILRQLINEAGVQQEDISVGDPMKNIYESHYTMWHAEFPDVHYLGNYIHYNLSEADLTSHGRTPVVEGVNELIYYSDPATITAGLDFFYTVTEEADYMISIPTLKAHARAGITLTAKIHFGSHTRDAASHLHPGLVAPDEGPPVRTSNGMYRVQVDLMGHPLLGGNTMLFLVDALYAGSEATDPPTKWDMAPFSGDWTSSVFLSQDQVAIESVCFDFLRTEYNGTGGKVNYPNYMGVDDYIMQAADPVNWPEGITYKPDGVHALQSLGVHEHWNNATDKSYSRNLGMNEGIELLSIPANLVATAKTARENMVSAQGYIISAYPNPFQDELKLKFRLAGESRIFFEIYNLSGQLVYASLGKSYLPGEHEISCNVNNNHSVTDLPEGIYIATLRISNESGTYTESKKIRKIY